MAITDANDPNERVTVSAASPTLTTTPSPSTHAARVTLKDTAFLAGGYNPTGTITFTLSTPGQPPVDTETVTVSGNGTYTTPTGFTAADQRHGDGNLSVERRLQRRRQQQVGQRQ